MIRALVSDLFFQVRIRSTAASCGQQVEFVASGEEVVGEANPAELLIVDLTAGSPDPLEMSVTIEDRRSGRRQGE